MQEAKCFILKDLEEATTFSEGTELKIEDVQAYIKYQYESNLARYILDESDFVEETNEKQAAAIGNFIKI